MAILSEPLTDAALIALASALVHFHEGTDPGGHQFDITTARHDLEKPEVADVLAQLDALALLPRRRDGKRYLPK
jgi:hypothetical protein